MARQTTAVLLTLILAICGGCASYQLGSSLHRADIRTVHVPIFQSNSYRRELGEQLTEAVVKEIEARAFKVVCESDADSILTGQIIAENKTVLGEDVNDVPRSIGVDLIARIRWESRAGDLLRDDVVLDIPPVLTISQSVTLVPEGGQSVASAHQAALIRLARQIVDQLEYPW